MRKFKPVRGLAWMIFFAAAVVCGAGVHAAAAHETDQFTMPLDKPLADLGDYFDAVHYSALERAVVKLNGEVTAAMSERDPARREAELLRIGQPQHVVEAVFQSFDDAFTEIQQIEDALRSSAVQAAFPGQYPIYIPSDWIYSRAHYWLDPRSIVLLFRSSTVKAYGVYFGTDKLSHFHHLGRTYYENYLGRRKAGMTHDQAVAWVVKEYSDASPIGEGGLLGFMATGVYSNADLAANFMGMKFCMNITEAVTLKGETRPPLLVRKGELWRLNKHVRPESGWFGWFVSDQWNEALNPSWFEWDIHEDVRAALARRAPQIAAFYTKVDHRPSNPEYFDKLAHQLSTFDGEDYGHCQQWDRLFTIAQICWPVGH